MCHCMSTNNTLDFSSRGCFLLKMRIGRSTSPENVNKFREETGEERGENKEELYRHEQGK